MEILKKLNVIPKNLSLYKQAVTHKSFANENKLSYDYQTLEFVGDAIISKIIAVYLYKKGLKTEGELTRARISMVQSATLVRACNESGLVNEILLGRGESSGAVSSSIAEDVFEAFCGALYFDQSEQKVFEFLKQNIIKYYETDGLQDVIDYKTNLQEALQTFSKHAIEYKVDKDGIHDNSFVLSVWCNKIKYGEGTGRTKKEAERNAAKNAVEKLASK